MVKNLESLTYGLFQQYGDRKKQGRISVFVDLGKDAIYAVPRDIEHVDFFNKITYLHPEDEFWREIASRYIPSHIDLNLDGSAVEGIVTGVCGMEIAYGSRHSEEDLYKAHEIVHEFVNEGDIPISELKEDKVVLRYSI